MAAVKNPVFGTMPDGTPVELVTLKSPRLSCEILTYGGAVRALTVPDRDGKAVDVALGFDDLDAYLAHDKYIGALVGRCANRIGGAEFTLNGVRYPLYANTGVNHLHGGQTGFDRQVWTIQDQTENTLTLSLVSPDGQEGYPGALNVQVTYTLTEDALEIGYRAESDRDTVCNLTNHTYFNLSGHDSGTVEDQYVQLFADFYTPTDAGSIPTGAVAPVEGTPMDLRSGKPIGEQIDDDFQQLRMAGGYDHNWVLRGPYGALHPAARAWSEKTGIRLETLTTAPGVQFYAGNYLDGCPVGKGGAPYAKRWGFCLETQLFPDAVHHAHFPSAILRAGDVWRQKTAYVFPEAGTAWK